MGGEEQRAVLGVPQEASVRYDDGGNGTELLDDFSGVVEPPHMGVAGGEKAIPPWVAWVLLDRGEAMGLAHVASPVAKRRPDRIARISFGSASAKRRLKKCA